MFINWNPAFFRRSIVNITVGVFVFLLFMQSSDGNSESRQPVGLTNEARSSTEITELFEVALQFEPESEPVTASDDRDGTRLGGGKGTVKGARINGTVRYDVYEKGGAVTGENQCQINIAGVIETDDGAQIRFESLGFGLVPESSEPNKWIISASLNFNTNQSRYEWLNKAVGLWNGGFDTDTGQHYYHAYLNRQ